GENGSIRNGEEIALPAKGTATLRYGDTISIRTPGGGGYGPPRRRSLERRTIDKTQGRI
ncbi:hydantoinase B/oxoprolinase family protein, partial [Candidatus Bipolaricaulota bacterium]|nr:hydantoinase B/oxoprolinase family protein [Candidatus Bipolaricaulota bacterium]